MIEKLYVGTYKIVTETLGIVHMFDLSLILNAAFIVWMIFFLLLTCDWKIRN